LQARITEMSKHVGVFPEQFPHWEWIKEQGKAAARRPLRLLSLFGYTGVASLIAASTGFTVTHLDASKPAMNWAKHNQEISGMQAVPIRWILDDTVKFVNREIRRGARYDAIIMDPPAFGRGPKQEVWKVERQLVPLLEACRQILSDDPIFVMITMYAIEASPLMIGNFLADMMKNRGNIEVGELAIKSGKGTRILPMSIFGRWSKTS
jgi:23S rRNA (cytosine1962-C5)-methyltransferase